VKLVDRREIGRREPVEIFSGLAQGPQDRIEDEAAAVVALYALRRGSRPGCRGHACATAFPLE